MKIYENNIKGVYILESSFIKDDRGAFTRLFCVDDLKKIIGSRKILQINYSLTHKVGAIRGMHYQNPPYAELKIIRCIRGRVFDVALDLRAGSPTFLQWVSAELTPENCRALVIPEGCAHGFQVLDPDSELLYLHTAFYSSSYESGVRFDEPRARIIWPLDPTDLSVRDQNHPRLEKNFLGITL